MTSRVGQASAQLKNRLSLLALLKNRSVADGALCALEVMHRKSIEELVQDNVRTIEFETVAATIQNMKELRVRDFDAALADRPGPFLRFVRSLIRMLQRFDKTPE